ncbi:hypothetical protein [Paraclostridium bifermentans]|nr:hypothetical protein [Paraclostridium bifermentans]GIM32719.1 hypothetical protein PAGU1678_19890 [Paraclostridium bifermentans subsp. muricolitidis]
MEIKTLKIRFELKPREEMKVVILEGNEVALKLGKLEICEKDND